MPLFIGTYDESDIGRKTSSGDISCTRLIRRPVELIPTKTERHPIHPNSPYQNDQGRQTPVLIGSYANTPTENKTVHGEFSSPRPRRKQTPSECNSTHPDSDTSEQRRQTPLTIGSYEKPSFGLATVFGEFSSEKFASRPQRVHTTSECNSPHPDSDKNGHGRHTPVVIGSVSTPETEHKPIIAKFSSEQFANRPRRVHTISECSSIHRNFDKNSQGRQSPVVIGSVSTPQAEHKPITAKFSSDQFSSRPTKLVHTTSECSSIRPNFDQGRQSPVVIGSVSTPETEHKPITAKFSSDQFASRRRVRTTSECSSLRPNFDQGRQSPVVIGSVSNTEAEHKSITAKFSSDQFANRPRRVHTTSECSSIRPIFDANDQGRHTPVLIGSVSTPGTEHKPITAKFSSDQFASRPTTLFHTTSECSSLRPNINKNDQESETILHVPTSTRPLPRTPLFESEAEWFAESGEPQETKPSSVEDTQHEPEKETQENQSASQAVAEKGEEDKVDSKEAEDDVVVATEHPQISETPSQPLQAAPSAESTAVTPASMDSLTPAKETQMASQAVAEQPPANKGDSKDAEDDVIIATKETQLASQPVAEHPPENKDDSKEAEEDVFIATEHQQISETPSQPLQAAPSEDSTDTAPASNDSLTSAKETQSASQAVAEQRGEDKVDSKESEDDVVVATEKTQLASPAVAEHPSANKGDSKDTEDDVIIATEETQLASQPVAEHPPEKEGDSKEAEEDVIIASEHPQISETPAQPLQAAPSEDSIAAAPSSADSLTPAKQPQISETSSQPLQAAPSGDSTDTAPASIDSLTPAKETQSASQVVTVQRPEDKGDSKQAEDHAIIVTEPPRVYEPVTVTHKLWPVVTSTEPPPVCEAKTSVQPAGKEAELSSITEVQEPVGALTSTPPEAAKDPSLEAQLPRTDAVPSEARTDLRKSDDEGSVHTETTSNYDTAESYLDAIEDQPSPPEANEEPCKVGPEQTVSETVESTQATSLTAEPPAPASKSVSRETTPSDVKVDSVVTRASNAAPRQQTSPIEEIRKWKHDFQNIKNATCVLQRLLSSNADKDTASRNADEIAKIHDVAKSMPQMQSQLEANVQHYRTYVEQKKAANEKPAFTVENMLRELAEALDDLQFVQREYLEFTQKEDPTAQPSEKSGSPFKLRHDRV